VIGLADRVHTEARKALAHLLEIVFGEDIVIVTAAIGTARHAKDGSIFAIYSPLNTSFTILKSHKNGREPRVTPYVR